VSLVRIATRASELAQVQARAVARRLEEILGVRTELVPLKTTGDRRARERITDIGGKAVFVKEIEEALLDGRADLAVHSTKDLPADSPDDLALVAFPERADPRDALVARERGATLETLRRGARVGTGSPRRGAQIALARPDLEVVGLRGNVKTRIAKIEREDLDAVFLACAGMDRLGLGERIDERLAPALVLPAVGQGALAVQGRRGDAVARDAEALSDPVTHARVTAERAFLSRLGGDCHVPIAALAELDDGGGLLLRGLVADPDGRRVARGEGRAARDSAEAAGVEAALEVLQGGGDEILRDLRGGLAG